MIVVKREGVPPEPWKMSVKEGKAERAERGVPAWGGTKVSVANKNCTTVRTVGGSWRRMMRMARTSRRGQDVRMVAGTESMLAMEMEADLEALVSARRRAEGMGSKGPLVPLSYERHASTVLSSEASDAARVRSPLRPFGAAAMVLTWALDPGAEGS
jgi:hypothetical protein